MADETPAPAELKTFPWVPVFVAEWLSLRMLPEQKGALMDLWAYSWTQRVPCTLPDDDAELAVISGLYDRWDTVGKPLLRLMTQLPGGLLRIDALYNRYLAQVELSNKRRTAGKRGNESRAKGIARGAQPVGVASIVADQLAGQLPGALPGSVYNLISPVGTRDKRLNELPATDPQNGRTQLPPGAERIPGYGTPLRASYDQRVTDFCTRWSERNPDEHAKLVTTTRIKLGVPTAMAIAGSWIEVTFQDELRGAIVALAGGGKVPTWDEYSRANQSNGGTDEPTT